MLIAMLISVSKRSPRRDFWFKHRIFKFLYELLLHNLQHNTVCRWHCSLFHYCWCSAIFIKQHCIIMGLFCLAYIFLLQYCCCSNASCLLCHHQGMLYGARVTSHFARRISIRKQNFISIIYQRVITFLGSLD